MNSDKILEDMLRLLIRNFGADAVAKAAASLLPQRKSRPQEHKVTRPRRESAVATTGELLEKIRKGDAAKYRLLSDFYLRLRDNEILKDTQDIRLFATSVGIKEIQGKSRKELVPRLMRLLIVMPFNRLQRPVESADSISETNRERGYSVLTDKLLGKP